MEGTHRRVFSDTGDPMWPESVLFLHTQKENPPHVVNSIGFFILPLFLHIKNENSSLSQQHDDRRTATSCDRSRAASEKFLWDSSYVIL